MQNDDFLDGTCNSPELINTLSRESKRHYDFIATYEGYRRSGKVMPCVYGEASSSSDKNYEPTVATAISKHIRS
jgi:hypothetical protein